MILPEVPLVFTGSHYTIYVRCTEHCKCLNIAARPYRQTKAHHIYSDPLQSTRKGMSFPGIHGSIGKALANKVILQMCQIMVATKKYPGCTSACNTTHTNMELCDVARARSPPSPCANPTTRHLGQSTAKTQCPNHRDEGYSRT